MTKSFDVFLSHNSKEKSAVRELAEMLRARGLKVWLDEWELVPGYPWQEALEEIIETTQSSAVLVGKDGLGPWQDAEMRGCLSEFVNRKLPVIPVLLPGASEVPRLPFFLQRFAWVDLRGGLTEEGIDRLQWGITGKRLDRSKLPATPLEAPEAAAATKIALVEAQLASAEARSVQSDVERPRNEGKKQSTQRATARWSVSVWIGLLTLLGSAIFFWLYFLRPSKVSEAVDTDISVQDEATPKDTNGHEEDAPGIVASPALTGKQKSEIVQSATNEKQETSSKSEPANGNSTSTPASGTPQTKMALKRCESGKEFKEVNGVVFVRICPGTFIMGSAESDKDAYPNEKPAHEVRLTEGFWIGRTEITNQQYRRFQPNHQGEDTLPASGIRWSDANEACNRLFGGGLPTEAQWEYAARADSDTIWSFGNEEERLKYYAWFGKGVEGKPHPVGGFEPNTWGLRDMHGNVWEWVADWHGDYENNPPTDPKGPKKGKYRVLRGGSFADTSKELRIAFRNAREPGVEDTEMRLKFYGFRCVLHQF